MTRIAFIGAGNMAAAMIKGVLAVRSFSAEDISCFTQSGKSARALSEATGIRLCNTIADLVSGTKAVVIAFKPQHLASMDPELARRTEGQLIISVLAGKRLSQLASHFPAAANIVRTMPNTPGQIGAGITGFCSLHPLSAADRLIVEKLLAALGQSIEVAEEDMDALTAVSGSGPAYVFQFAAHLRDAGVAGGLRPDISYKLTLETILGAAKLLARSELEPEKLRDQVTSPNGTTMAALKRGQELNLGKVIEEMVLAAKARSIELSKDS